MSSVVCTTPPSWSLYVGVAMSFCAQPGINIGQNIQADGLTALPEEDRLTRPYKSKLWVMGLIAFIGFSLLNFVALSFAPANILLPLECIQFVSNVGYAYFVHHKEVPTRMVIGVCLALTGTFCTLFFGSKNSSCYSVQSFEQTWYSSWAWITWVVISVGASACAGLVWKSYTAQVKAGGEPPMHQIVLPVTFMLVCAMMGGSYLIVNAKVFSEMLGMLFQGDTSVLSSWVLYVALLLTCGCGIIWVGGLTGCLSMYDPLVILPLMVAGFIVFGSIGGGIYFDEFSSIGFRLGSSTTAAVLGWLFYVGGMGLILAGLYLIAKAGSELHEAEVTAKGGDSADAKARARKHWRTVAMVTKLGVHHIPPSAAHLGGGGAHPLGQLVMELFNNVSARLLGGESHDVSSMPDEATPLSAKKP